MKPDDDRDDPLADVDDEETTCWCGATGTYDELFEDAFGSCCGTRSVECFCGGDFCVCHNHGQAQECPGCPDCEDMGEFDPEYDPDDWDNGYPEDDDE